MRAKIKIAFYLRFLAALRFADAHLHAAGRVFRHAGLVFRDAGRVSCAEGRDFQPDGGWFTFVGRTLHAAGVAFYVGGDDLHTKGSRFHVQGRAFEAVGLGSPVAGGCSRAVESTHRHTDIVRRQRISRRALQFSNGLVEISLRAELVAARSR